jgi:hypothetical protein
MTIRTSTSRSKSLFLAPFVAAAATAVAIIAAPTASAVQCRDSGGAKICQRPGHASLHAKPTPRNPNGSLFSNAWLPGYGRGHLPPLLALD